MRKNLFINKNAISWEKGISLSKKECPLFPETGITLIALVVTIVVLLILAGVTINFVLGENGILQQAKNAQNVADSAAEMDKVALLLADYEIEKRVHPEITVETFFEEKGYDVSEPDENGNLILSKDNHQVTINPTTLKTVRSASSGTSSGGSSKKLATGITLGFQKSEINLGINESINLSATVEPKDATSQEINFTTESDVISLEGNKVTGVKAGRAIVTASTTDESGVTENYIITVKEATAPFIIASVGAATHTASTETPLSYSWEEMNEIAKAISLNYQVKSGNEKITKATEEVKVTIDGKPYTVGVGDILNLGTHKVRILGFNHDRLTDVNAYNDGYWHQYAGISLEFVTFLTSTALYQNDSDNGGWVGGNLYASLNTNSSSNIHYSKLPNAQYIKQVSKTYGRGRTPSSDYLWLLACSEIWNARAHSSAAYGQAPGMESTVYDSNDKQYQYKFYLKNIGSTSCPAESPSAQKPDLTSPKEWYLRSPWFNNNASFCIVTSTGGAGYDWPSATRARGVAPGFCL